MFHEIPTLLSVLGALVICLGTLAVILSETWQSRQQRRKDEAEQVFPTATHLIFCCCAPSEVTGGTGLPLVQLRPFLKGIDMH